MAVIMSLLIVVYFLQLGLVFYFLFLDMFTSKKKFLFWCVPIYPLVLSLFKKIKDL